MNAIEILLGWRSYPQQISKETGLESSKTKTQSYQRTFGDAMHARDFPRQQKEAMIASGALNKITSLGMPQSLRSD